MKIIEKNVSEIKPYENNPRKNDDSVKFVANSIKEFGFKVPIIIDKNDVVVAGHTRLKAAEQLGLKTVPVIIADDLTDEQIRAYRIADNKVQEMSYWDTDVLGDEILQLMDDFDFTDFGFGDFELRLLTEDMTPEQYDKDLEMEYSDGAEGYLKGKRVIITYTDENEDKVKELLGVDNLYKVSYSIEEILDGRD